MTTPPPQRTLRQTFEPVITPMFRAWWRFNRALTLGVRGFAQDPEGRIVLVRHTYRSGWWLPGGGVERAETTAEALQREMQEEAGVYSQHPPILFAIYSNHNRFKNDHVLLYQLKDWHWGPTSNDGEIADVEAFAPAALPEDITAGTRARIAEILENAPVSDHW
ncbi:MAG: NUDIX domain-containing protein [Caulobacterales bacterium]